MKKIMYVLAMAMILPIGFVSCDKDDDEGGNPGGGQVVTQITATNVTGDNTAEIATVKAFASWDTEEDWGEDVLVQAPYNEGFTLNLPTTMASKYLEKPGEDMPAGVTMSNTDVQTFFLDDIRAFTEDGGEMGHFYLKDAPLTAVGYTTNYYTSWMYADRDVTITGEYIDGDDYLSTINLNLKKGWNVVYDSYTYTETGTSTTMTSQKPAGVGYSWDFGAYHVDYAQQRATQVSQKAPSIFQKLKRK
jgi:hypothetical protein